jgi:glycine/D-amino acid oxidase-like deaminating enzyme
MDRLAYANYGYEYFRQLPDGSFLLGGGRGHYPELEVGYDEVPTAWVQATLEEFLQKHFPDVVKAAPIVRRWAGIMGFAVDGLPLVGRLPEVPGQFHPIHQPIVPAPVFQPGSPPPATQSEIYYAVGLTGHGMGWGLITADAMIEQMLGHKSDGGLFDVKRLYA